MALCQFDINITACLPLDVFETDQAGNRAKVDLSNPLARLLRYSPNQYMTAQEFREAMTMQLCFYGNSYALAERNRSGDVISLLPLLSANMDVRMEGKILFINIKEIRSSRSLNTLKYSI